MFVNWRKRTAQHQQDLKALELKRDAYADAGKAEKQRMGISVTLMPMLERPKSSEWAAQSWNLRAGWRDSTLNLSVWNGR